MEPLARPSCLRADVQRASPARTAYDSVMSSEGLCRACKANEHDEGQSFCDECEAQLEAELAKRAIRSSDDLMEAWKGSVPESYANYVALCRDDSLQGLESVKQHAESLGQLLSRDSILYYAHLKMIEDYGRSVDARFNSSFAVSPRTATEPDAVSMTESTAVVNVTEERVLRVPEAPSDYEIPAGYPTNWHELRRMVYRRDNYRCRNCDRDDLTMHCHHVVPITRGGSHKLGNLVTLCEDCHVAVHPHMADGYRYSGGRKSVITRSSGGDGLWVVITVNVIFWSAFLIFLVYSYLAN